MKLTKDGAFSLDLTGEGVKISSTAGLEDRKYIFDLSVKIKSEGNGTVFEKFVAGSVPI